MSTCFDYLGSLITFDGRSDHVIKKRIVHAKQHVTTYKTLPYECESWNHFVKKEES